MTNYRISYKLLSLSLGVALGIYLLWPLSSNEWTALSDESSALATKTTKLNSIKSSLQLDSLPNILLIVADDLAVSDLSINGNSFIQTRNIDRLAREGVHSLNAYCTAPICATSRAAILTGKYQNRFGFEYQMQNRYAKNRLEMIGMNWFINSYPWELKWVTNPPDQAMMNLQGLPSSEITIAEILQKVGYQTGIIGKWHLGKQRGKLPKDFGFDYQYGFYNSHSLYIPEGTPGYVDTKVEEDWTDQYIWESQRDGLSAVTEYEKEIEEDNYLTDQIASKTIKFIEDAGNDPFFAYVPFSAPHTPFQVSEVLYNQLSHIDDPVIRTYQAMIRSLDDAVGRIINHLEENDLMSSTLIIFASDNGGARYTTATDNGPYKGGKINQFEGGLRVPFILHWEEHLSPDEMEERVSTLDIVKSITMAAQIEMDNTDLDGLNLLAQKSDLNNRDLFWMTGHSKTIISGDYKLIFNTGEHAFQRLYYLKNDPYELQDISIQNPLLVEELIQKHDRWSKEMAKPLWPGVVNYKIEDDGVELLFES